MQRLRYILPVMMVVILLLPATFMAQEANETLGILDALAVVQENYGSDVVVLEADYDAEHACWAFHLEDDTELCVDEVTGEILLDDSAEMTPEPEATPDVEATEEADDAEDMDDDEDAEDTEDADDAEDTEDDEVTLVPAVTMEDAIAIALSVYPSSTVSNINLEQYDNMLVWDIELDDGIRSVDVDAITGAILSFGYEEHDNNSYMDDNTSSSSDSSYTSDSSSSSDDHHEDDDDHEDDDHEEDDD